MNVKKLFDLKGMNLIDVPYEIEIEIKKGEGKCALHPSV